jgi:hypothetical protein
MKVLCLYNDFGPKFVREGWGRVFSYCGHEFRFWNPATKPTFEIFDEFEPDLLIATTYDVDRALYKNIVRRPAMKVALFGSAYGPIMNEIDEKEFPIVLAKQAEVATIAELKKEVNKPDLVFIHTSGDYIHYQLDGWAKLGIKTDGILNAADIFVYLNGVAKPEFACDVGFVGGYWPYKSRNLNKLLSLAGEGIYNIKIFGNQKWEIPQYLGYLEDNQVNNFFASAKICPNISEPHSTSLGLDIVERPFKVFASGGFCISDRVKELTDLLPDFPIYDDYDDFKGKIDYWLTHDEDRHNLRCWVQDKIWLKHTYFERVAQMLENLNLHDEAEGIRKGKDKFCENVDCN